MCGQMQRAGLAVAQWFQGHTVAVAQPKASGESMSSSQCCWFVQCGGECWREKVVHVHCDNLWVVAMVNLGYSRVPQIMGVCFFIRAHFEINVMLGTKNDLANAISRDNIPCSCRF